MQVSSALPVLLAARSVNWNVPLWCGTPLSVPFEASVTPSGRVPLVIDQEIGESPVAVRLMWTGVPTWPLGNGHAVVIVGATGGGGALLTVIEHARVPVWTGLPLSVASSVKFDVPAGPEGVPLMVLPVSSKPTGSEPDWSDSVTGAVPVVLSVWL